MASQPDAFRASARQTNTVRQREKEREGGQGQNMCINFNSFDVDTQSGLRTAGYLCQCQDANRNKTRGKRLNKATQRRKANAGKSTGDEPKENLIQK